MPGRKRSACQPKGPKSPFACFLQECSTEYKRLKAESAPEDDTLKPYTYYFTRNCAERWKNMTEIEKSRFKKMSEEDKQRYHKTMEECISGNGRKAKKKKDPNAPKACLTAFIWFSVTERPNVKIVNPKLGLGEISKILSRMWAGAAPELKQKYEILQQKDKIRYDLEMAIYKAQSAAKTAFSQSSPAVCEDEDEDED